MQVLTSARLILRLRLLHHRLNCVPHVARDRHRAPTDASTSVRQTKTRNTQAPRPPPSDPPPPPPPRGCGPWKGVVAEGNCRGNCRATIANCRRQLHGAMRHHPAIEQLRPHSKIAPRLAIPEFARDLSSTVAVQRAVSVQEFCRKHVLFFKFSLRKRLLPAKEYNSVTGKNFTGLHCTCISSDQSLAVKMTTHCWS